MARLSLPPRPRRLQSDTSLAIVNIVLLLLFFFLATGSMMGEHHGDMPIAMTEDLPIDQLPKPILIIAPEGLSLNGTPITAEELPTALLQERSLNVLIDKEAPALSLLGVISQPGMELLDIQLVTIHRRAAADATEARP